MKPTSELLTQAQIDRIEQRWMTCRGGGHHGIRQVDDSDDLQFILWDRRIFADIVDYDAQKLTCRLVGPLPQCVAAKRALAKMDVTASLPRK